MNKINLTKKEYKIAVSAEGAVTVKKGDFLILETAALIAFNPLKKEDEVSSDPAVSLEKHLGDEIIRINWNSSCWRDKSIYIQCKDSGFEIWGEISGRGEKLDTLVFFPESGKTGLEQVYAPRFDWSLGKVHLDIEACDSLSCHQWLSPPPFYYGFRMKNEWLGAGLAVEPGAYNFLSLDYNGKNGPEFCLTYEGHTTPGNQFISPRLMFDIRLGKDENDGLFSYTEELASRGLIERKARDIPEWWKEPIFCGWGQQRLDYRNDHDNHEMGNWINAGDYSTQIFYEKYLNKLEEQDINPGIVIIDCFWAQYPAMADPHPLRWPDMRGFIDRQHAKGRKVLLWLTPIICESLPLEMCMTVEGKPISADPTSPEFRAFFADQVKKMISSDEGCLDADGFKIDFTQNISAERGVFRNYLTSRWGIISEEPEKIYPSLDERDELVKLKGEKWGTELIKEYLTAIRIPMKEAKEDSLLITHTANPYFAGEVDMLRLNDMDGTSPDVLGIMSNRAAISQSCNPHWLIDTDNDLMINKKMWREYIALQPQLGNPDTYYATGIAQSGELFDDDDYKLLRNVWKSYRDNM